MLEIDMACAHRLPHRGDELFHVITRFEYALKEVGFCKGGKNDGVEADWNGFAKHLTNDFLAVVEQKGLAPTILVNPPSKQVIRNKMLGWDKASPPANVHDLFVAIRRVRNNLVHGGKSGDEDGDRNGQLISEAIDVLLEALRSYSDLRFRFEGRW